VAAIHDSTVGHGLAALAGLELDPLTEQQVVEQVLESLSVGRGGWVATLNIDICRAVRRDADLAGLLGRASLIVPDGMPLIWAAKMRGDPLPERVTGASLIFSLSEAAAASGRSVYLLGGELGVPEAAGAQLCARFPGLVVAGTDAPPVGFDETADGVAAARDKVVAAAPDVVYVGLGFPKQERLIAALAPALPHTWFVACGAAIPFAAGALPRAPEWMQQVGMEWLFRLLSEPRRLARRYLVDDLPFAAGLLAASAANRLGHRDLESGSLPGQPDGRPGQASRVRP
jgi:N-acetylglucosaminyldiphosphoundecaprenol N-acetyl-beta-D-mannosaminyltransferase